MNQGRVMSTDSPALLLTGASGLVGSELRERLVAARPDRRLFLLTRRPEAIAPVAAGMTILEGDLRAPGLGLSTGDAAVLGNSLTEIIHSAADTRFDLPIEEARATNVGGTENLLRFALGCRKLAKFAHISTVYVAGRASGRIPEAPFRPSNGFSSSYQQTKLEAEELVAHYQTPLPVAIFRLSSIIGDSRTGRVRQFNHVHQLMRLFPRNVLPVAPAVPDAPLDLIATDWTVSALAWLFENRFAAGRVYHLCAGPGGSFSVGEMLEITREMFETHPKARRWLPIRLPKLVSLPEYEAWVEKTRRGGDRLLNELLRVLGFFLPHLGIRQAFENKLTLERLAASGLQLPSSRETYRKVLAYCLDSDWGRLPV